MSPEIIVPGMRVKIMSDNRPDRKQSVRAEGVVMGWINKFVRVQIETPQGVILRKAYPQSLRPA